MNYPSVVSGRNEFVYLAYNLASEAHEGDTYEEEPFIVHPVGVASLAGSLGYPDEVIAACLLHDTIEDTLVVRNDLVSAGIPLVVVDGVEAVTYTEVDEAMGVEKMNKARSHPIGHVTKFCDSSRNLASTVENAHLASSERTARWLIKYTGYLSNLRAGLPTVEDIQDFVERSR